MYKRIVIVIKLNRQYHHLYTCILYVIYYTPLNTACKLTLNTDALSLKQSTPASASLYIVDPPVTARPAANKTYTQTNHLVLAIKSNLADE